MNSNKIIPSSDPYLQVYNEKYIQKIDYLSKLITEDETGSEAFKVVNFEAGLGKSRYTDIIIKHDLENGWENRKYLIVKRFNDESLESAKRIESGFLKNRVAVITSETWEKRWRQHTDELMERAVIIISHKRYIDLCTNEKEREIYTTRRHTLIVDEKVNFPIYTYTDKFYSNVRGEIAPHNRETVFDQACHNLNKHIDELKESTANLRIRPEINEDLLRQFREMMLGEIINANATRKRVLYEFLETVSLIYSKENLSIINSGKICTLNRSHKHWGLQNNIILDASAGIDGIYTVNPDKYILQRQTSFIDHSDSKVIHIKLKSSKSAIKHNQTQFFSKIVEQIKKKDKPDEKSLIVVHKTFAKDLKHILIDQFGTKSVWMDKENKKSDPDYSGQNYAIAWFGNLIGKNNFMNFDNVWILGTPNIPLNNYLIQYMQYKDDTLGKKGLKVYQGKFKNDEFREVQEGYIAAEIYQSLKRIQRNTKPKGNFYIVNGDEAMVRKAISPMKNANITETIEIELVEDKPKKTITKIDLIADYLSAQVKESKDKTQIKKAEIAKLYGTIRWDRVKVHPKVSELMVKGKLKEQQRYFVIFNSRQSITS